MLSEVSSRQLCGLQKQWLLNTVTKFGTIRLKRFPPSLFRWIQPTNLNLAALDFGRVHLATIELQTNWAASLSYPELLGRETIETLKGTSYEASVSMMKTWTHIISCSPLHFVRVIPMNLLDILTIRSSSYPFRFSANSQSGFPHENWISQYCSLSQSSMLQLIGKMAKLTFESAFKV